MAQRFAPDLWMTYHAYYKAPDMLGPWVCRRSGIPYVVFQGIYSTKRRRDIRTGPGFLLNRRALRYARHIFTNRREDEINLRRIVPEDLLSYAPPGIYPEDFVFDPEAREKLRRSWNVGGLSGSAVRSHVPPGRQDRWGCRFSSRPAGSW